MPTGFGVCARCAAFSGVFRKTITKRSEEYYNTIDLSDPFPMFREIKSVHFSEIGGTAMAAVAVAVA